MVSGRIKSYFVRGLAVLLPTILTIWICIWGYNFIQTYISKYVNIGLVHLIVYFWPEPKIPTESLEQILCHGAGSLIGFFISLVGVCLIGAILASVVGRTFWRKIENFLMRFPLLRAIYPNIKQVTDFFFTDEKMTFSRVVAIEYPRNGIWSIGMVTGSGLKKITDGSQKEFLTVFVPTSPTPFTGFVVMVPKENTIEMDMTIEQALRFTVSGGVITPEYINTELKNAEHLPARKIDESMNNL